MATTLRSPSTNTIINHHHHHHHHHHPKFVNNLTNNGGKSIKPPLTITTNPNLINISTLSHLYASCRHSPHLLAGAGELDAGKLAVAVKHSAVVVAVFAAADGDGGGGRWGLRRSVSPENGELVGFGRAVSDLGLTASIYDVMVIPSLRRLGIGTMIVQRILRLFLASFTTLVRQQVVMLSPYLFPCFRMLTNRGVYDISALCSDNERSFFAACSFGDDILGSTTMTYAGRVSSYGDSDPRITRDNQGMLLAPPSRLPLS